MKINKKYLQAAAFIAVYLFALYLWTLPFQDNKAPYGEFDAISHWELGDFIAQYDRTFVYLPPFLDFTYGGDNNFKPHTLWYHPPFHTDFAIISAFANDRMVPIFLTNAIFASSVLISVFFVINRLFGFLPGILSSLMLAFSLRDIMPYLWGQWPERFAYAFVPLVLYCFYVYFTSYSKENSKPRYLYIMSILLAVDLFIHPMVFFHSLIGLFVLAIALVIKQKKFPFNLKHIGIALAIFVVAFSIFPYQSGNVIVSLKKDITNEDVKYPVIYRLLQWAPNHQDFSGSVPSSYFSFEQMIGYWGFLGEGKLQNLNSDSSFLRKVSVGITNLVFIFIIIGILVMAFRRENRDIFMLAWLLSFYLLMHRDMVGILTFLHRSLSASAHVLMPIVVIGALSLPSLFKLPKNYKIFLRYGIAALIVFFIFHFNTSQTISTLSNAYDSPLIRINPAQIEVSEWLKENLDENENVSIIGPPQQILQKVWWMASYSHRTSYFFEGFLTWGTYGENREETVRYHLLNDYIVFDYSDIALLSDRSLADQWLAFEQQTMGNHTLLYNRNNIRVYKYAAT